MLGYILVIGLMYVNVVNPGLTNAFGSGSFLYVFGLIFYLAVCYACFLYLLMPMFGNSFDQSESPDELNTRKFQAAAFVGLFALILVWFCVTQNNKLLQSEGLEVLILN